MMVTLKSMEKPPSYDNTVIQQGELQNSLNALMSKDCRQYSSVCIRVLPQNPM